jgi:uncharacterized membrane protein YhaH (DUF805 family)
MDYFNVLGFLTTAALCIASIVILASSVNIKGKSLLLAFFVLMLISNIGSFSIGLFLRTGMITFDTYRQLMMISGAFFTVCRLTGWVLLLMFVIGLRSGRSTVNVIDSTDFSDEEMTISKALFSFKGRLCRSDYWLKGFMPMLPLGIMNNILAYGVHENWSIFLVAIISIASIWPSMALLIKRLHDRNRSGWFACIMLIPIVGPIWLLVEVWFLKGTDGPNRFGSDPLKIAQSVPAPT